jgi:hypothetical protein
MVNEETKPEETPTLDPTTSVLFDLEMRIVISRDNLNLAEKLLNELREVSKVRKLQHEDLLQLDSLLVATKEFFEIVSDDLVTELYQSLKEEKEDLSDTETA